MARRILLIDDDRMQSRIVQGCIGDFFGERFDLDSVLTYEEGLSRLMSGSYAACLLDYRLGPRNGIELLREAKAQGCRTPIVFLTAETSETVDVEATNAGAYDYLVKSELTPRVLERSLRYALRLGMTLDALNNLATHDALTGLLNRREFDRIIADEVVRALRFKRPLALIIADIDHFKQVNDTHGHFLGDKVLCEVASRIRSLVRTVDRVMRYGGEEFAVVLMETELAPAADIASRLCAAIESAPVALGGELAIPVRISAGVAVLPDDAQTSVALVDAADQALYAAKNRGRNRAVTFVESRQSA